MDKIRAMQVFREVVRKGSFSAAADTLNLANSAVSRQVSELERWLSTKLLYRTTRTLSLTDDGRIYLEKFDAVLNSVDELEQRATSSLQQVRGNLRITAPLYLGRYYLNPMIPGFIADYPKVNIALLLVDRFVDLVEEGFDLALRVGELPESNLIARQLGEMRLKAVASPAYLRTSGTPIFPAELSEHNCLFDTLANLNQRWQFTVGQDEFNVPVKGNFVANDGEMMVQMALAGLGIAYLPDFFVDTFLKEQKLVQILEDYTRNTHPISLLYPHNRHMNLSLRTLVDRLFEQYAGTGH
ncbi:MAG: LysR family transcriptional regulator [Gammaproteobacteria bacterium]|nr:LysR family transcriptional regulator [Gammaproteobacteria bacterium]